VFAFVPVIALYFLLKPPQGNFDVSVELSTSQFIAITSGFAASVAFAIFYKAALAHPKQAMDLGLPREFAPAGAEPLDAAADDEEAPAPRPPPRKLKGKGKKGKAARKAAPPPKAEEADAGEEAPSVPPSVEEEEPASEKPKGAAARDVAAKDEEEVPSGAGEPVKAG
jgi:phosphatidylglycerol---prolipoprotein diacylglyceryl transferase